MSLLEIGDVEAGYGRIPVLHGVSLEIGEGEVVGLVGPNGAGKTTLMRTIFRLLPLMSGTLRFDRDDLDGVAPEALSDRGLSLVPQGANTFPELSIEDNLGMSLPNAARERVGERVDAMLRAFPRLAGRRRQRARTLSGGERQMLALAGAMMSEPRLLALDEPTTGLAPATVESLIGEILRFRDAGSSILWVIEENPREILQHVDRIYIMQAGSVVSVDDPRSLLEGDALERFFFGVEAGSRRVT